MIYTSPKITMTGDRCQKYPSYCYKIPIVEPVYIHIDSRTEKEKVQDEYILIIQGYDPNKIYPTTLKYKYAIDYSYSITDLEDEYYNKFKFWFLPNEYTKNKEKQLMLEHMFVYNLIGEKELEYEALRRLF